MSPRFAPTRFDGIALCWRSPTARSLRGRIVGPRARDKGKPVERRGRKAYEATAPSECAMPVGLPWTGDSSMRVSRIALAALVAATACTDSSTPATAPSANIVAPIKKKPPASTSTAPASLFSGYSPRSPHWPHITTMMTDFYYSWTPAERAWAGTHYDYAMSGLGPAWRAVNPTVVHIPYALLWTVVIPPGSSLQTGYYADMQTWFRAHPQYSFEKAFTHRPGRPRAIRLAARPSPYGDRIGGRSTPLMPARWRTLSIVCSA